MPNPPAHPHEVALRNIQLSRLTLRPQLLAITPRHEEDHGPVRTHGGSERRHERHTGALLLSCTMALAHAVLTLPALAQTIQGRVLDQESGSPVPVAGIFLLEATREIAARVLTDGQGRFVLNVPGTGRYYLVAQGLGYFDTESPLVSVSANREYEVDLSLRPEPIRLEGLSVEVPLQRHVLVVHDVQVLVCQHRAAADALQREQRECVTVPTSA